MLQEMAEEAGRPCLLVGRIGGVAGDEREVAGLDIPFQQRPRKNKHIIYRSTYIDLGVHYPFAIVVTTQAVNNTLTVISAKTMGRSSLTKC